MKRADELERDRRSLRLGPHVRPGGGETCRHSEGPSLDPILTRPRLPSSAAAGAHRRAAAGARDGSVARMDLSFLLGALMALLLAGLFYIVSRPEGF